MPVRNEEAKKSLQPHSTSADSLRLCLPLVGSICGGGRLLPDGKCCGFRWEILIMEPDIKDTILINNLVNK